MWGKKPRLLKIPAPQSAVPSTPSPSSCSPTPTPRPPRWHCLRRRRPFFHRRRRHRRRLHRTKWPQSFVNPDSATHADATNSYPLSSPSPPPLPSHPRAQALSRKGDGTSTSSVPPQHTHARVEERYKPHTDSVASKISRIDIVDGTCAIIADNVPIADLGTSMAGEGEQQRGATSTSSYRPMMRTTI